MENINKPHTPIKEWAEDDRPREKMMLNGASSLSKAELLAILINHGTRSRSALELARDLLEACGRNLNQMARMNIADFEKIKGIGPAKAVTIKAALELGIRKEADRLAFRKTIFRNSQSIADFLQPLLQDQPTEVFVAVFLNKGQRVIDTNIFSQGGITGTVVDVRTIARRALELGATGVVVSHNHPSGNLRPSNEDKHLTQKLKQGLKVLDIALIDHIIVSDEGYYSLSDTGEL
jgi:DNA repair protein RadC